MSDINSIDLITFVENQLDGDFSLALKILQKHKHKKRTGRPTTPKEAKALFYILVFMAKFTVSTTPKGMKKLTPSTATRQAIKKVIDSKLVPIELLIQNKPKPLDSELESLYYRLNTQAGKGAAWLDLTFSEVDTAIENMK